MRDIFSKIRPLMRDFHAIHRFSGAISFYKPACHTIQICAYLTRTTGCHNPSAVKATARPHVDYVVGIMDHLKSCIPFRILYYVPSFFDLSVRCFTNLKYVNRFNRGVTRVQEMPKENGNLPAKFDVNTITAFRVNVHATNESDLSKGTSQTDKSIEDIIIEFCKEPRTLAKKVIKTKPSLNGNILIHY